jgi:hypothetical protein
VKCGHFQRSRNTFSVPSLTQESHLLKDCGLIPVLMKKQVQIELMEERLNNRK